MLSISYHWYLVIIYHPEHVLRPPPAATQNPNTRSRKSIISMELGRESEVNGIVPASITTSNEQALQAPASDVSSAVETALVDPSSPIQSVCPASKPTAFAFSFRRL